MVSPTEPSRMEVSDVDAEQPGTPGNAPAQRLVAMTATEPNAASGPTPLAPPSKGRPDQDPAPAEPSPRPAPEPSAAGPGQVAKAVGSIVAPTTLLTAVLYYFGWEHANYFFGYFGLDPSVLGFTPIDYIVRSVGWLEVPIITIGIIALLALWGNAALSARLTAPSGTRLRRAVVHALAISGLAPAGLGLIGAFAPGTRLTDIVAGAPLSLAVGVLLLAYAVHLRRSIAHEQGTRRSRSPTWAGAAEWAIVFALVGISLFAAANDYASVTGTAAAHDAVAALRNDPDVALYSTQSLSLHAPGVREERCRDPQAAYRYRYDGLKLLLESGGQYLFLPRLWTRAEGVAILIPQSDSLRLEFYPPSARNGARPAAC